MKNFLNKRLLPHLAAVVIFLIISVIYCAPTLKGEVPEQQDNQQWKAMAQQSFEFKEKYGHFPFWTNSMFSGMPAYQIAMEQDHPVTIGYIYYIITLGLPKPINFFFLACICFYILMIVMRINPWIGIMGAIAYAFSTYNPIIIAVGHDTKMLAIAYAPAVISSFILLFRKEYLGGAAMLALFLGFQMSTAHLQIVYYTLLTAGIMSLVFIWQCIRNKEIMHAVKSFAVAVPAAAIGIATTAVTTLPTYDYAKYSMRGGGSELSDKKNDPNATKGGLDKDYAFRWSYGISETFTLAHPSFYGGGNGGHQLSTSSQFAEKLVEAGYPEENAVQFANAYAYWGDQPVTSGPVYLGIIICFLFILGLFIVNSWHKWWILVASLVGIMLAWGKNFEAINYFLFDYLPFYKKFRAPTQGLFIPQLCFALFAAMALQSFLFGGADKKELLKKLKLAGLVTAGIFVIFIGFYATADFTARKDYGGMRQNDTQLKENFVQGMLQQMSQGGQPTPQLQQQAEEFARPFPLALKKDRQSLFMKDLLRNLLIAGLAFGLLYLFVRDKAGVKIVLGGIIVLTTFDLLSIGSRYLSKEEFVDKDTYEQAFLMSPADAEIKKDNGYYRVFNQTRDPFNESSTAYYHNAIGGYHPAKLQIYQDIIEYQIGKGNKRVLDMLNGKYIIFTNPQNNQPVAQVNPDAFGPVWLVRSIHFVKDAKEEMAALDSIDVRDTAIVQNVFRNHIKTLPQPDSSASITFVENKNDIINYKFSSPTQQFAVFSEVFYPSGWKAFADGKPLDIIKTDYVLRGLSLPAGNYTVEFRFEPSSYRIGNTITLWSTLVVYLLLISCIVVLWKKENKKIN